MKIDESLAGLPPVRGRETRKSKTGAKGGAVVAGNDSVDITPKSARLNQLDDALAQIDSHDAGKVEEIRAAIANGTFQVDEEAVASAILDNTVELLRRLDRNRK